MDYLRLTPQPHLLIVSKITEDDDEPRELMRIKITNPDEARIEINKLVNWAINTSVGIEIPVGEPLS